MFTSNRILAVILMLMFMPLYQTLRHVSTGRSYSEEFPFQLIDNIEEKKLMDTVGKMSGDSVSYTWFMSFLTEHKSSFEIQGRKNYEDNYDQHNVSNTKFEFLRKRKSEKFPSPLHLVINSKDNGGRFSASCQLFTNMSIFQCTLSIKNVQPADSGTYSCMLLQTNGNKVLYSDKLLVLDVSQTVTDIYVTYRCDRTYFLDLPTNVEVKFQCVAMGSTFPQLVLEWIPDSKGNDEVLSTTQTRYFNPVNSTYTYVGTVVLLTGTLNKTEISCRVKSGGERYRRSQNYEDSSIGATSDRVQISLKYENIHGGCVVDSPMSISGTVGKISSFNGPASDYSQPAGRSCQWEISVDDGDIIQLAFSYFHMESGDECPTANNCRPKCCEKVNVFDDGGYKPGGERTSTLLASYCGSARPQSFTSNTNRIRIDYEAYGQLKSGHGFALTWKALKAMPPVIDQEEFHCGISKYSPAEVYSHRIVNGRDAIKNAWPWHALITTWKGQTHCGGTLIHPQWVVTAAHCFICYAGAKDLIVYMGKYDQTISFETGQQKGIIQKIFKHQMFNELTLENDIALLKLESPVQLSDTVRPACLPSKDDMTIPDVAYALGFGHTSSNRWGAGKKNLQEVKLSLIDIEECKAVWDNERTSLKVSTTSNLCTLDKETNKDTCNGDSGGPLLSLSSDGAWILIGITSWGPIQCGNNKHPGVYTYVRKYLGWLKESMNTEEKIARELAGNMAQMAPLQHSLSIIPDTEPKPDRGEARQCIPKLHPLLISPTGVGCTAGSVDSCWEWAGLSFPLTSPPQQQKLGQRVRLHCDLVLPPSDKLPNLVVAEEFVINWHFLPKTDSLIRVNFWAQGFHALQYKNNNENLYHLEPITDIENKVHRSVFQIDKLKLSNQGYYYCSVAFTVRHVQTNIVEWYVVDSMHTTKVDTEVEQKENRTPLKKILRFRSKYGRRNAGNRRVLSVLTISLHSLLYMIYNGM